MSQQFAWVPDVERGEWLRPMEDEPFGSFLSIVPRGFEAYARVFHPVERDRPRETKTWQGIDPATYFVGFGSIEAALESERASWAMVAASFGTTMHAEAQYARLIRRDWNDANGAIAPDGWRYGQSYEGCLDATSFAALSAALARHTTTPDAGVAAIWEGWGGLVSSAGVTHFSFLSSGGRLAMAVRRGVARVRSLFGALAARARNAPEPGSGVLAREVAVGPRFDLHGGTGRHYVLFEAGASDFADVNWPSRAPWVDGRFWAQSPSILWPDDHAWVLATEIDYDSTLVAGTEALIRELVQTPGLEVLPIRTDADLTIDGDKINRFE